MESIQRFGSYSFKQKPPRKVPDYGESKGGFPVYSESSTNQIVSSHTDQENQMPPNVDVLMSPNEALFMWLQSSPMSGDVSSQSLSAQFDPNQLQSMSTRSPSRVTEGMKLTRAPVPMPQNKPTRSSAQVNQAQKPPGSSYVPSLTNLGSESGFPASREPSRTPFAQNVLPPNWPSLVWMQPPLVNPDIFSQSPTNLEWASIKPAQGKPQLQSGSQVVKVQGTIAPVQVTQEMKPTQGPVQITQAPVQVPQGKPTQSPAQVSQMQKPSGSGSGSSLPNLSALESGFPASTGSSRTPFVNRPFTQNLMTPNVGMQMLPSWMWMQPAPASQVVAVQATMPPIQVTPGVKPSQAAVQTPQEQPMQSLAKVSQKPAQAPQNPQPAGSKGTSSGPVRYVVISSPSGFQTRYLVKSFNRYVRGKKLFSQTTYIPLNFKKSAPTPSVPGEDCQTDTV